MKSDRKPPLAKSQMRLRTRRALRPTITSTPLRTPIGSIAKTQMKRSEINPEYRTISTQLRDLEKMVQDELGALSANVTPFGNHSLTGNDNHNSNTINLGLFERGRFYDAYSARRDERLRRKQSGTGERDEPKTAYNLGVKVESTKKKKAESLKKPMAVTCTVDRSQRSRYALRSIIKKPPLPVLMTIEATTARKPAASRAGRK